MSTPIRVFYSGGRFLVWKAQHIYALRVRHRLVGALLGALPTRKGQGSERGAPLSLTFEEALTAAEVGIVEVVDCDSASPPPEPAPDGASSSSGSGGEAAVGLLEAKGTGFVTLATECSEWDTAPLALLSPADLRLAHADRLGHARVFCALWTEGYFLTTALKFGGDYLCYAADPMSCHALAIVHVRARDRPGLRPAERSCAGRFATAARKLALLASADAAGDLCWHALDAQHNVVEYELAALRDWDPDAWKRQRPAGAGARAAKRPRDTEAGGLEGYVSS